MPTYEPDKLKMFTVKINVVLGVYEPPEDMLLVLRPLGGSYAPGSTIHKDCLPCVQYTCT